jgi:hypothetical protein
MVKNSRRIHTLLEFYIQEITGFYIICGGKKSPREK